MCCAFVGMNTNDVVKMQSSEQRLPSVSSQTPSEYSSVHTSKINKDEEALTSERNKQYLGEIGGEINTLTKGLGYYRCIKCTWIKFCCR